MKIPNGWKPYEFGKAVSFNPKVQFQRGEQYMFIEMDDITPADKYVTGKEKRVYTTGSCSKFKNDDVLFARITPCLDNKKIATAAIGENQVGFGSTEFIVLRAKENITIQEYVHYLSKSEYIIQNAINSYVGASGRQRADAKFIKKVIVPIPKIPEQQRIASILSAYDDLIENNNKRIALLEQMAEQIYKEWFVRMRFPGFESTEFEKGVPKGWEVKKFGRVYNTQYGNNLPTEKIQPKGKYAVYGAGGLLGFHSRKNTNELTSLITCRGNGSGTVWRTNTREAFVTNNSFKVNLLLPIKDEIYFSFYHLKHAAISQSITGSAQPQITIDNLSKLNVLFPTEDLIKKFINVAKGPFQLGDNLRLQNHILIKTLDLLLPRLISGKLKVK